MSKNALAELLGPAKKSQKEVTGNEFCLFTKGVDQEKRQIRFLASNNDLDRHGERILPEAFKKRLHIYKQNPVILAGHVHSSESGTPSVVGRAVEVWVDKQGLWIVVEFAKTELAEQYWQLYSGGYMRAVSVGFIPISHKDEDQDGKRVRVLTEVELIEVSLVAVPSNRAALVKHKANKKSFVEAKKQEKAALDDAENFAKAIMDDELFPVDDELFPVDRQLCGCDSAVKEMLDCPFYPEPDNLCPLVKAMQEELNKKGKSVMPDDLCGLETQGELAGLLD